MEPFFQDDGSVAVPMRAEADDGTAGEGVRVVAPGEPDYEDLLAQAEEAGDA